jgi:general stress protein CsbA
MEFLLRILGFGLLILGIYFLGKNIIFTTNISPYWWRGIAADASVLALMLGVLMLVFLPANIKNLGWTPIIIGIVLVFLSSRAILNPTSLWEFFVSFLSMTIGYRMLVTGRSPL